jgi:Na+-translocating ferredoxin:NAD+ oxidoreductase subunit B
LVVGMYEHQVNRLTPEFVRHFNQYTNDRKFGTAFLSTELPQMRTIPVARSIRPEYKVSTFDEVTSLIQQARPPFAIIECICRKKRTIEGQSCQVTQRTETCLAIGDLAHMARSADVGRDIPRDEALSILDQNQKEGLVLQPANTETVDFICSCCGCCCGMLEVQKKIPRPVDYWASNFHAAVDAESCQGCGTCEKRCHVGAIAVSEKEQHAAVDLDRCIGCGVCVTACPTQSLSLAKKAIETRPPQTREELYDIILSRKKGPLGKMKVTAKLIYDAVRTGQTHLLKG